MKTKHLLLTAAIFIAGLCINNLRAQGFSGPYAPSNWVTSAPVGGTVDVTNAPTSISLIGPNGGSGGDLDYSFTVPFCSTTVSFNWVVSHPDCGFDVIYYGVNGTYTFLTSCSGSGSVGPMVLYSGDVLTFRIHSNDGIFGSPTFTISNFTTVDVIDVGSPVPDNPSLPNATGTCEVTLTPPTATDACAGTINGTTPNLTITTSGTTVVTWTYTDGAGNTATQTQNVIISPDGITPTIACHNDTTLVNDENVCGAVFDYQIPSCGFNGLYYDQSVDDNVTDNGYFNESNLPQWIADDFLVPDGECWNITNFSANIWENPLGAMTSVVVNFHADAGGSPGAIIGSQTLTSADWTSTFLTTQGVYSISDFDFILQTPINLCGGVGGTTYWLSFYDNASAGFQVAWSSTNNIVGYGGMWNGNSETGPWNSNFTDFIFNVGGSFPATVSDNCPSCPTIAQTTGLPPGSVFPVGTTTNTFTATDGGGNVATCSFDVVVMDIEDPIPNVDSNLIVSYPSTAVPIAIIDGGVIVDSVQASSLPTILSSGDIGSVCLDIQHSFDGDLLISLISPQGTTLILSANHGGFEDDYIATCFDMDAATSITTASAPFVGSFLPEDPLGFDIFNGEDPNGYWKLVVEDVANGDVGALMQFSLNFDFHWDTIMPVAHVECSVPYPTAWDNCNPSITATTSDPTTFTSDGTYLVTWTYTDGAGNTYVQTQEVIAHDVTGPVPTQAVLPPTSGSCSVSVESTPTATDACTGGPIVGTTTDATTYNVAGTYVVTWTYTDGNGNTTTQTQTFIVTDTQDPVPTVPILPNVTGNCSVTVAPPPTATDNCAGTVTGTTTDPLVYNVIGTFFIVWTYDDGNGNTFTQNQTVVVNPCLSLEDESGQWSALISPNPGSGIFTVSLSQIPTTNTEVRLVDALGQVLYSGLITSQIQQFDFSYLASATYYLLINSESGQISKPVIIQH